MNRIDPDRRGWSDRQLLVGGVVLIIVAALVTGALVAKSRGDLDARVTVSAELTNVGDGLPQRADVKFRGVLVGAVTGVEPASGDRPNIVHIDLKPDAAKAIPESVTARVVPSNVFAVSSVQLVDNGAGQPLRAGATITEDTELPTVLFQTTITRMRDILAATERDHLDPPVGLIELLADATDGRGDRLLRSGAHLQRMLAEFNGLVAPDSAQPSTISALTEMAGALESSMPTVTDALQPAVTPLRTVAEKDAELNALLAGGLRTGRTTSSALGNHVDQMIEISTNLEPVLGVFAVHQDKQLPIATRLKQLSDKVMEHGWDEQRQLLGIDVVVSFSPARTYVRSDCPRYGALDAPSCHTAPEAPTRYGLPDPLLPGSYVPPPDLAPPPGAPPSAGVVAPAGYGGNVGPVGSPAERGQLALILGEEPSSAQHLLLGPLARGTTVNVGTHRGPGGPG